MTALFNDCNPGMLWCDCSAILWFLTKWITLLREQWQLLIMYSLSFIHPFILQNRDFFLLFTAAQANCQFQHWWKCVKVKQESWQLVEKYLSLVNFIFFLLKQHYQYSVAVNGTGLETMTLSSSPTLGMKPTGCLWLVNFFQLYKEG